MKNREGKLYNFLQEKKIKHLSVSKGLFNLRIKGQILWVVQW